MEDVGRSLYGRVKSLKKINLPDLPNKGDVSDYIFTFSDIETAKERLSIIIENAEPYKPNCLKKHVTSYTATELLKMEFPEPKWVIEGILSEGVNILGGKPKQGKSILSLNIGISIATGSKVLGKINVEKGAVLYLALEDSNRRIQRRLKKMKLNTKALDLLYIESSWNRTDQGGLEKLKSRVKEIPNIRLVIIDTLKAIKPFKNGSNKQLYDVDYELISSIKDIADEMDVTILIIHHLRKSDAEDIMDTFSGTFGLTAAADGLIALKKMTGQSDATLSISGRDVDTNEYALRFYPEIMSWNLIGETSEVKITEERQDVYDCIKKSERALSPKEILEKTGINYSTINKALKKLNEEGSINRIKYGKYEKSSFKE